MPRASCRTPKCPGAAKGTWPQIQQGYSAQVNSKPILSETDEPANVCELKTLWRGSNGYERPHQIYSHATLTVGETHQSRFTYEKNTTWWFCRQLALLKGETCGRNPPIYYPFVATLTYQRDPKGFKAVGLHCWIGWPSSGRQRCLPRMVFTGWWMMVMVKSWSRSCLLVGIAYLGVVNNG